jgi:hypothetical protein
MLVPVIVFYQQILTRCNGLRFISLLYAIYSSITIAPVMRKINNAAMYDRRCTSVLVDTGSEVPFLATCDIVARCSVDYDVAAIFRRATLYVIDCGGDGVHQDVGNSDGLQ